MAEDKPQLLTDATSTLYKTEAAFLKKILATTV